MTHYLRLEGYQVLSASDGEQALGHTRMHTPDLVVLDVALPKLDGLLVCQRMREFSAVPVIFVTTLSEDQDKVRSLDGGADDYLTKPFSVDELLARMRALLRRAALTAYAQLSGRAQADDVLAKTALGKLTVDYTQHLVTLAGREVVLTPIEYRLLAILAHHARQVVTQEVLLESIWGKKYIRERHLLAVVINRLRRKLEPVPSYPRYLLTRAGVGYLLTGP
jgi:DNA-binding response OmpR family regulator